MIEFFPFLTFIIKNVLIQVLIEIILVNCYEELGTIQGTFSYDLQHPTLI